MKGQKMKRIGVLTSGGDTPGMNAAIRAVFKTGVDIDLQVMGIYHGYKGLIEGRVGYLAHADVESKMHKGGTILRTARSEEFKTEGGIEKAISVLRAYEIEGLIVIGGDGSFKGADAFSMFFWMGKMFPGSSARRKFHIMPRL